LPIQLGQAERQVVRNADVDVAAFAAEEPLGLLGAVENPSLGRVVVLLALRCVPLDQRWLSIGRRSDASPTLAQVVGSLVDGHEHAASLRVDVAAVDADA